MNPRFLQISVLLATLGVSALIPRMMPSADPTGGPAPSFRKTVRPFLVKNCLPCHNKKQRAGDLRLDRFRNAKAAAKHIEVWERVHGKLIRGEMPPPGRPRPDPQAVRAVLGWIESQLETSEQDRSPDPGRVTARRLNRVEYNNTVRDLLGVRFRPADDFPADDTGYGFDNIGDVLSLSPLLMEKYLAAAEKIVLSAIVVRPRIRPTLTKYLSPRIDQATPGDDNGIAYSPEGALAVVHEFPVDAEYELRIRVVDRRYRPKEGQPPPPLPAPAHMAVSVDGQSVKVFQVEPDRYERGMFDLSLRVEAGNHRLSAEFPVDGMENLVIKEDPNDPDEEERKLFADYFVINGPFNPKPPPLTEAHKRIMVCGDPEGAYQPDCARRILNNLIPRAYRRPVGPGEIEALLPLVESAEREGDSFAQGIQQAIKAILVSPHFLFRIEQDPDPNDPAALHEVSHYELATRLSYFLWSSLPDDDLFRTAAESKLREAESLEAQVRRMIQDPKSWALVENFAGQWLQLRNLESVAPDPDRFPDFDDPLRNAMRRETELFFATVMREDRSILDFLDAPFTFLNGRLARHYGVEGVVGKQFRRVELDGGQRSGVLTQASILTVSSYPTRTSPVLRGKWLLENVLGTPPPAPPAEVPELDEAQVGLHGTLREQLEQHRAHPSCAVCHARIDPLGFGLENYDAIGAWRTHERKFPIDASGAFPNGESFSQPQELKALLKARKDEFARCLTEKMLTYALGRGLERYDKPTVNEIVRRLREDGYRFSRLVLEIVQSMPFRMRRGEGGRG